MSKDDYLSTQKKKTTPKAKRDLYNGLYDKAGGDYTTLRSILLDNKLVPSEIMPYYRAHDMPVRKSKK